MNSDCSAEGLGLDSAVALGEGGYFQDRDETGGGFVKDWADSDGVGSHEVGLELGELCVGDVDICEFAEPGVDSVRGNALCDDICDSLGAGFDFRPVLIWDLDGGVGCGEFAE